MIRDSGGRRFPMGWAGRFGALLVLLAGPAAPLAGQTWNDSTTLALVARGVAARERARPDSSLRSYRTRAHGFVFFLGQAGSGLEGTPRLIKADELEVEVYWQAPGVSKQVILGWRDGRWLPTDINYHRDHLGIVTNNFGDLIRIGEGDEVRDVPHPLAPGGPGLYEYRLRDSVRIRGRDSELLLQQVEVRPRDPSAPRVIGTLSLDAATGDLVRFRFSFTPAAYLDSSLEDISVQLENAQVEQRWWLPWRQEIEIRRRVSWFDFPARSIIRGRWEIGDYQLNLALPSGGLAGPAIGGLRRPDPRGFTWSEPLADAVRGEAAPVERRDLDQVRGEVERIAEGRVRLVPQRLRPGVSALSDLARVNRVQGLALGVGAGLSLGPRLLLRPRVALGTSDGRVVGDLGAVWRQGGTVVSLAAGRRLRDLSDEPPVSPLVNSLLAQEGGRDLGDYVLLDQLRLGVTERLGRSMLFGIEAGAEQGHSVRTEARPARGSYRPNPPLGEGTMGVGRLTLDFQAERLERSASSSLSLAAEGGIGSARYARATVAGRLLRPLGPGGLLLRVEGGAGSEELPAYRSFAIGGWGTLPGEPFRAWGGKRYALAQLEYRLDIPFPALPLGAFVSTGHSITVAPFIAAGWAGERMSGLPWQPSHEVRPVAGMALEWLHRLIRVETGVSLRTGRLGVTVDVSREWWGVL